MPILLLLFVVVAVATTGLDLALRARQAAFVGRHRGAVPAGFADAVSLADHQRAADYEQARLRLGAAATVFGLLMALGWACFGYDAVYAGVARVVPGGLLRSVLFLLAIGAVSKVLTLPFAVLRTFRVEQRFGFNRTRPRAFAIDQLKAVAFAAG